MIDAHSFLQARLEGSFQDQRKSRKAPADDCAPEVIRLNGLFRFLCRTPDDTKGSLRPRGMVQNIGLGVRHNPAQSVLSTGTDTNKVQHVRSA